MENKTSPARGINYKCAMLYYSNSEWARAARELSQITSSADPHIYELLAKCYLRLNERPKYQEFIHLAINTYTTLGETEKAERLRQNIQS
jgi:hypothetical protein